MNEEKRTNVPGVTAWVEGIKNPKPTSGQKRGGGGGGKKQERWRPLGWYKGKKAAVGSENGII